jgi:hypothetical protein
MIALENYKLKNCILSSSSATQVKIADQAMNTINRYSLIIISTSELATRLP